MLPGVVTLIRAAGLLGGRATCGGCLFGAVTPGLSVRTNHVQPAGALGQPADGDVEADLVERAELSGAESLTGRAVQVRDDSCELVGGATQHELGGVVRTAVVAHVSPVLRGLRPVRDALRVELGCLAADDGLDLADRQVPHLGARPAQLADEHVLTGGRLRVGQQRADDPSLHPRVPDAAQLGHQGPGLGRVDPAGSQRDRDRRVLSQAQREAHLLVGGRQ